MRAAVEELKVKRKRKEYKESTEFAEKSGEREGLEAG